MIWYCICGGPAGKQTGKRCCDSCVEETFEFGWQNGDDEIEHDYPIGFEEPFAEGNYIRRYNPEHGCSGETWMQEHLSGDYVKYADIAPLLDELEKLRAKTKVYPVAECPHEWKDGRFVLGIWRKSPHLPVSVKWTVAGWVNEWNILLIKITHVTALPT